ncbi:MAG: hypothetical protein Q8R69_20455 [Telluria sp.]|nr:hypothetical protein [Telluria sp.]
MSSSRPLPLILVLLLGAGGVAAEPREWVSYRDAYRAMVVFEKYGKPKNLIQNHYQVMPKDRGVPAEGLQLALNSKSLQLKLPLDATGRAVFPLLKAAYDENAELVLNRKVSQLVLRPRVSIVVRPDGVYEAAELQAACEQALNYQRFVDASAHAKKCVGVRFAFAGKGEQPGVKLRRGDVEQALPVLPGAAFADDPNQAFLTVTYRFVQPAAREQVVTRDAPLAIAALFE